MIALILQESNCVLRMRSGTIIVKHRLGYVSINACIDHTNVAEQGKWIYFYQKTLTDLSVVFHIQYEKDQIKS